MSKLESQKGGPGEGSWEAFWVRKTVPKWDFEGCMMALEKDTNFDAKMDRQDFQSLRKPEAGCPLRRSEISEIRDQKSDVRK